MMMGALTRAACAACVLIGAWASPALATHDTPPGMVSHETSNGLGTMTYQVYAPEHLVGPVPLFVHLHGGNNSTDDAAHRSRLNELASQRGFVVAYPQADPGQNTGIWDDVGASEEGRDGRASSLIAQVTREVMAAQPIDSKRVFVGGISAGASMAGVMAAQYPDLYTALHLEAGAPYGKAEAAQAGRNVYAAMGAHARRMPLMLSYGTIDPFAQNGAGEDILVSWLIANDLFDDGVENGSVSLTPAATRQGHDGKDYSVDTYVDAQGCVLAERWLIQGLFHAYAGGDQTAVYDVTSDPNAPNMREVAYDFFLDQFDADGPPGCKAAVAAPSGGGSVDVSLALLLLLAPLRRLMARRH
jgi:poly(hydroxyalkanoate) depolymerase family esterase